MNFSSLRRLMAAAFRSSCRSASRQQRRFVPTLDHLEARNLLTAFTLSASTTAQLVSDIGQANADTNTSDTYTIQLTNGTYSFASADNATDGGNALPVITATNLTIQGNGSILTRSGTTAYRLFDVASGATLDLQSLTLSKGLAAGATAQGGALLNHGGNVTLSQVALVNNQAIGGNATGVGQSGGSAAGGALYVSGGKVNLTNCTISANSASGGMGGIGGSGGSVQGGGIYANGATLTVSGGTVNNGTFIGGNGGTGATGTALHATGGAGGASGSVQGGGIYVHGGKLTLENNAAVSNNTISKNTGGQGGAGYNGVTVQGMGGAGGAGGVQEGGGIFASQATVLIENGSAINDNTLFGSFGGYGGNAGQSKTGGAGGAGGLLAGGGVFVEGGSVSVTGATTTVSNNTLLAGGGGYGGNANTAGSNPNGNGGAGGAGGAAAGGGVYVLNAPVTITGGTTVQLTTGSPGILANSLSGGRGGNGGAGAGIGVGGVGGAGGKGQGGGVFVSGSAGFTVALGSNTANVVIAGNSINGGNLSGGGSGGQGNAATPASGGAGGSAAGGGAAILGETLTMKNATLQNNSASGGNGGSGAVNSTSGVIGNFGAGGNGLGGGLYVAGNNVSLLNSTIYVNGAVGGGGTSGGTATGNSKYGQGGTAQGGAVYASKSTVTAINSTFANNLLFAGTDAGNPGTQLTGHETGGGKAQGAGLYSTLGTLSLINNTVAWNYLVAYTDRGAVAGQGAGVYNGPSDMLNLENTIIALDQVFSNSVSGESSSSATFNDLGGAAPTQNDSNLIGNGLDANAIDANMTYGGSQQLFAVGQTNNTILGHTLSGQVPINAGGLTYTLPLSWTAPAISQGDASAAMNIAGGESVPTASATDQRGFPRVIDGKMDIGAVEAQLMLNGSVSSATATPGGTLTYTLTITNNEATAVSGTLTDQLPSNTTFGAGNGSNWTSSGGTATTAFNVAANSSQTFTLIVNVSSSAPASTVLTNTATIAPTGNLTGIRSASQISTVPGQTTTDITSKTSIFRSPVFRDQDHGANAYEQAVLLINNSGTTYNGPVALVLSGLPSDVTLTNASGYYNGSPYVNIVSPTGTWRPGWWHFVVTALEFNTTNRADIHYTPLIVQGI